MATKLLPELHYKLLQLTQKTGNKKTSRYTLKGTAENEKIFDVGQEIMGLSVDSDVNISYVGVNYAIRDENYIPVNPDGSTIIVTPDPPDNPAGPYEKEFELGVMQYDILDPNTFFGYTLTDTLCYGPNYSLTDRKVKIYYLGYKGNLLAQPVEVPMQDIDTFPATNPDGAWIYRSDWPPSPKFSFGNGSMSTKVYKLVVSV